MRGTGDGQNQTRSGLATALRRLAPLAAVLLLLVAPRATAREPRLPVRDAREAVRGNLPAPGVVPFLGVVTAEVSGGLRVQRVVAGSAAQLAGVRIGDVLTGLGGWGLRSGPDMDDALAPCVPGERVALTFVRDRTLRDGEVVLGSRRRGEQLFSKSRFRLAVVPLAFARAHGDAAPSAASLRRFYFELTGRRGDGASLADYFDQQSNGAMRVAGDVLETVTVPNGRAHYARRGMGAASGSLYAAAARILRERLGTRELAAYDGVAFLYPGAQETVPGRALWPHRAMLSIGGRRLPYYVHAQETVASGEIGEHCHEFSHLLGLPDSYGIGHRTGSGDFCLMAIGHRGGRRVGPRSPFSMCAWCRDRLDWADTVTIDPRIPQRLRLRPVGDGGAVVRIPLTPRSDEYLVLEVRARRGFDADLPSAGLLVWHVGGAPTPGQGRYRTYVDLVEAHGVDTFDASLVRTTEIAFPTERAKDLTPQTIPAIVASRDGAFRVHLTDIRREGDGSVTLTVSRPRRVNQRAPRPYAGTRPSADGSITRRDPITGETIRFVVGPDTGTVEATVAQPRGSR